MTTGSKLRWGIAAPQDFVGGRIDMSALRDAVTTAEALGYDSVWTHDPVLPEFAGLDSLPLLAYLAGITSRVRIGPSVLVTPLWNPIRLAYQLASVDRMSNGRLVVGIGLGRQRPHDGSFGVSQERRVRRFLEGLDLMKRIWTGERVTLDGDFWTTTDMALGTTPVQRPHPPIWFGGGHPDALKRAARHADAWMGAGSSSTDDFKRQSSQLREFLAEAGKGPSAFPIGKRVYITVDDDRERARQRLRAFYQMVYRNADMADRTAVWGPASECVERLSEVAAAGAGMIMLNPVDDYAAQGEVLAEKVIPHV